MINDIKPLEVLTSPERATLANRLSAVVQRDRLFTPEAVGVAAHHFNYVDLLAYACKNPDDAISARVIMSDNRTALVVARKVDTWQKDCEKQPKKRTALSPRGHSWVIDGIGYGVKELVQTDINELFDETLKDAGIEIIVPKLPIKVNPRKTTTTLIGTPDGSHEIPNIRIGTDPTEQIPKAGINTFISHEQVPSYKQVYPGFFLPIKVL